MRILFTVGLLAGLGAFISCKKGEALNPIRLDNANGVTKTLHDSTYYAYPDGYTAANAFLAPIKLGIPSYLETQISVISSQSLSAIDDLLPSQKSILIQHSDYLSPVAVNTIDITIQTDVYVTYIGESTAYHNALAYYTYETDNPPTANSGGSDKGAMNKITYIFPNANPKGLGGGLLTGNKVNLGHFNPGTSIGFVLIVNGWMGTDVNNKNVKFYSQDNLNPETINTLNRHAILLYDKDNNLFLLGFEDKNRQDRNCDNDFNDILIHIESSTVNSISKTNVKLMTNDTNTGG